MTLVTVQTRIFAGGKPKISLLIKVPVFQLKKNPFSSDATMTCGCTPSETSNTMRLVFKYTAFAIFVPDSCWNWCAIHNTCHAYRSCHIYDLQHNFDLNVVYVSKLVHETSDSTSFPVICLIFPITWFVHFGCYDSTLMAGWLGQVGCGFFRLLQIGWDLEDVSGVSFLQVLARSITCQAQYLNQWVVE